MHSTRQVITFARFADAHSGTTLSSLAHHPRPPGPPVCGPRRLALGACALGCIATTTWWRLKGPNCRFVIIPGRRAAPRGAVVKFVVMSYSTARRHGEGLRGGQGCLVRAGVSLVNVGQISRTIPGHHAGAFHLSGGAREGRGLSGTHSVGHSGPMVESAKNRKLSSRVGSCCCCCWQR